MASIFSAAVMASSSLPCARSRRASAHKRSRSCRRSGAGSGGLVLGLAVIDKTPAVAAVSRPPTTQAMMALVIFALPFWFESPKVTPG